MAKGGFPGFGGGNMGNLIKQAEKMQKEMQKTQEELEEKLVQASVGGGAVSVVINGKKELKEIKFKPEIVDSDDIEMLQDLVLSAVNEGLRKVDELVNSEMKKITGGLPGLF